MNVALISLALAGPSGTLREDSPPCAEGVTRDALADEVSAALVALSMEQGTASGAIADVLVEGLRCTTEVLDPADAAAVHEVLALAALRAGDSETALRGLQVTLSIDRGRRLPTITRDAIPGLAPLYEAARKLPPPRASPVDLRPDLTMYSNGLVASLRASDAPTLIQVLDSRDEVVFSDWLADDEVLPADLLRPREPDKARAGAVLQRVFDRFFIGVSGAAGVWRSQAKGVRFAVLEPTEDTENPLERADLPSCTAAPFDWNDSWNCESQDLYSWRSGAAAEWAVEVGARVQPRFEVSAGLGFASRRTVLDEYLAYFESSFDASATPSFVEERRTPEIGVLPTASITGRVLGRESGSTWFIGGSLVVRVDSLAFLNFLDDELGEAQILGGAVFELPRGFSFLVGARVHFDVWGGRPTTTRFPYDYSAPFPSIGSLELETVGLGIGASGSVGVRWSP